MADEHKHGTMDISTHEKTFSGFIKLMTWSLVGTVGILIFLALTSA